MTNATIEKLAWVLIYGGLLTLSLGVFLQDRAPVPGWTLIGLGGVAAVVGFGLIFLRAGRRD